MSLLKLKVIRAFHLRHLSLSKLLLHNSPIEILSAAHNLREIIKRLSRNLLRKKILLLLLFRDRNLPNLRSWFRFTLQTLSRVVF